MDLKPRAARSESGRSIAGESGVRRPRAVIMAHDISARGGAERVAVVACAMIRDLGYDTFLASPGSSHDLREIGRYFDVDLSGVRLLALRRPGRLLRAHAATAELAEDILWRDQIRSLRPELVMNCMFGSQMPGLGERNVYYVHFPHELLPRVRGVARRAYVGAVRAVRSLVVTRGDRFLSSYDVVLANSKFTAANIEKCWHRRARVVYPPCAMLPSGGAARERWIVSIGRFQEFLPGRPHKRQDVLIEAFAGMRDLHRAGWQLHLVGSVGSAAELDRLHALADGLPVVFHPDATFREMTGLCRAGWIYWHAQGFGVSETDNPVAHEHFGITTVEAMSAGLIPIVYGSAGPAEVVAQVPGAATWNTVGELQDRTRRAATLDDVSAERFRAAAAKRASGFGHDEFCLELVKVVTRS